jgi:iron complex outermembrane receptor protein
LDIMERVDDMVESGWAGCFARRGYRRRHWLRAAVVLGSCMVAVPHEAAVAQAAPAEAEIAQRSFDFAIPAQKLSSALVQYTALTGVDLVFDGGNADTLQSPGATGTMTAEQALRRLLAGTNLTFRFTNANTVTLHAAARGPGEAGSMTLDPIRIEGEGETAWGPVDGYAAHRSATGTKTDTPLIDTPSAIKVVPRAVLEDRQVIRVEDALKNISGVNYSASVEQMSFNSRGFGAQILEDGITRSSFSGGSTQDSDLDPYKVERVEALKGPASMLYGRGNPGGSINLVIKRPLDTPYYAAGIVGGSHALLRPTIDVSGPIDEGKQFLYRFNGVYEQADSFRDHVESDRFYVMPALTWRPRRGTEVTADFEYGVVTSTPDSGIPRQDGYILPGLSRENFFGEPTDERKLTKKFGRLRFEHEIVRDWMVGLSGSYYNTIHDQIFTRSGSLQGDGRTLTRTIRDDWTDNTNYAVDATVVGHLTTGPLDHTLLLGGNYDHRETDAMFRTYAASPIDVFDPVYGNTTPGALTGSADVLTKRNLYGVYVQDQIDVTESVKLVLGGRYDRYTESQVNNGVARPEDKKQDEFSPRAGLLYKFLPSVSVYASYAESFQTPDGFATKADGTLLDPQTGSLYEAGVKTELFGGRLTATTAVYEAWRQNIGVADPDNPGFQITIGEQRSRGVELDVAGEVLPGWKVIGAYSYNVTVITDDSNAALIGNKVQDVPRHLAGIWTTYQLQTGGAKGLGAGGGLNYVGSRWGDNQNTFKVGHFLTADATLFYERDWYSLRFNVKNLFDNDYIVNRGGNSVFPGEPRTFLVSANARF